MLNNLPLQLTSFIGREREIAEIAGLLRTSRLVSLTGAGGVGKTRLALKVAGGALDWYGDGLWLVELAALADPLLVPQAVAGALGLREEPRRTIMDTLVDYLTSREVLLLLDNCEHLVGACAGLAEHLLRECSALKVLATSREALNVDGEVVWLVPSLSVPGSALRVASPKPGTGTRSVDLLAYEAAQLFVERARSVSPAFTATDTNASAVATVCQRLDGIPLALELAAARVRALTVEQIAARLDDRFRLLTAGSRTALPRHQTLRAMVDWSHGLLSEPERGLFRRLSVFAGGWTLEAAEAVCGSDGFERQEILDFLCQLVDKSLVLAEEHGGEKRYRLLETLRQYGEEKLKESGEAAAVRGRHLGWFRALAERADPEFYRAGQADWYNRFELEVDNVRAALEWSKTDAASLDAGLRLAGALWRFWFSRGHLTEGWEQLVALLASAPVRPTAGAPRRSRMAARARALNAAGRLGAFRGDLAEAEGLLREALALNRELGDKDGLAISWRNLGIMTMYRGDLASARAFLEESVALMRELGGGSLTHTPLLHLGWTAYFQGENNLAQALWEEGLARARDYGDVFTTGNLLTGLGQLALRQQDLPAARAHLRESLELQQRIGDTGGASQSLDVWACLAAAEGRSERALRLAGAAAGLRTALGAAVPPAREAEVESRLMPARQALGEAAAVAAWTEGAAMSLEQAVASAIESIPPAERSADREPDAPSAGRRRAAPEVETLTPREHEVALLLARGLTNREISTRLVIAEGTVGIHVDHILAKLGFHSRAQVAAWVAERGLTR